MPCGRRCWCWQGCGDLRPRRAKPDADPPGRAAQQSLSIAFNDGLAPAGSEAAAVDDVGFVDTLADDAQRRFGVRSDAVYGVGFSNGGSMVQRLAIESRYPFGFAVVVSAVRVATPGVARPAPLLLVFGTADPLNPEDGGGSGSRCCMSSRRQR